MWSPDRDLLKMALNLLKIQNAHIKKLEEVYKYTSPSSYADEVIKTIEDHLTKMDALR